MRDIICNSTVNVNNSNNERKSIDIVNNNKITREKWTRRLVNKTEVKRINRPRQKDRPW